MTIAIPTIGKQLGLAGNNLQWPLTLFSLFQGSFLLMAGALSDSLGRRLFFIIGIIWSFAISLAIAFVRDSKSFIALNSLLGFGCAILSPSATGLLATIADPKLRSWSYAALGAGQPLGFVVGLLAAGFLAERWRVIAYMFSGGAFLFFVTALMSLPAHDPPPHAPSSRRELLSRFDWLGAALSTTGLVLLTFALADAGSSSRGWKTPFVPAMLPLSALALAAWGLWEKRLERRFANGTSKVAPLLPLTIFRAPTLSPLLGMVFLLWLTFNVFSYFATLWIQEVQRLDSLEAAVRFIPMVVAGIFFNLVAGFAMSRIHALWLIVSGGIGGAGSCLILALINKDTSYWAGLFPAFILTVATDLVFPCAQLQSVKSVGPARAALAGGLFSTTTRLATSLGLALTATISGQVTAKYAHSQGGLDATAPQALIKGYQAAMWFCFAGSIAGVVVACIWLRGVGIIGDSVDRRDIAPDKASIKGREPHEIDDAALAHHDPIALALAVPPQACSREVDDGIELSNVRGTRTRTACSHLVERV